MPLPNYGYFNKEAKQKQELVFEMAPELVRSDDDDDEDRPVAGRKNSVGHSKRARVTTGKLGIDLERKLVIDTEKDKDLWKMSVDPDDVVQAKKFAAPERQILHRDVRSTLDSLISDRKAKQLKDGPRPSPRPGMNDDTSDIYAKKDASYVPYSSRGAPAAPTPAPTGSLVPSSSSSDSRSLRFSLPAGSRQQMTETTRTGVSIQPRGTYKLQQVSSSTHTSVKASRAIY